MAHLPTQEAIEKAIIGKRIVAVAWVPVPGLKGLFVMGSLTLEGGDRLEFSTGPSAVLVSLEENDHADA